jgi:hypothetical protein
MKMADINGDGILDYEEFLASMMAAGWCWSEVLM